MTKKLKLQQEQAVIPGRKPWTSGKDRDFGRERAARPAASTSGAEPDMRAKRRTVKKIDTPGSGVPPIFERQIASYDRPPSGERFENFSMRSVQTNPHDYVRSPRGGRRGSE
jgi:hypothetical protein